MSNNIDLYVRELEISKEDIKSAIQAKGVTPSGGLSSYAEAILSIESSSTLAPLSETITEAGSYNYNPIDDGVEGYSSVEINVDIEIPTFETQEKIVEIKKNGTQIITPDSGYDGLSSVEVNVSVPTSGSDKPKIMNGFRFTGGDVSQVDFSQYDWSAVYDTSEFFRGCTSTGDWSNFEENFNGEVLTGLYMFASSNVNANNITDGVSTIPNLGETTSGCQNMSYLFGNNRNISDITPLRQWNTSNVIDASYMFYGYDGQKTAPQISEIDLEGFGHPDGYKASYMFKYSPARTIKNVHPTGDASYMFDSSGVQEVININTSSVTDMRYMFSYCSSLTSIPQMNTSNVKSMGSMFYGCTSLTTIPQLDTSNVTDVSSMFSGCSKLTSIPQMNTSNVTGMSYMFNKCSSLTSIPQMNTSNVKSMGSMFYGCTSLTTIPQLDTSNVTSITSMFYGCAALIELPDFNCVKVPNFGTTYSSSWLYNCRNITKIGIVDCDSVTNIGYFFGDASRTYLTEFGGCRNLGKASSVSNTNSNNFMTVAPNLNYQSVLNVLNGLYDRASAGLSVLTLKLHANHLAMLSEDDIAIATNKGWTIV